MYLNQVESHTYISWVSYFPTSLNMVSQVSNFLYLSVLESSSLVVLPDFSYPFPCLKILVVSGSLLINISDPVVNFLMYKSLPMSLIISLEQNPRDWIVRRGLTLLGEYKLKASLGMCIKGLLLFDPVAHVPVNLRSFSVSSGQRTVPSKGLSACPVRVLSLLPSVSCSPSPHLPFAVNVFWKNCLFENKNVKIK